MAKEKEKRGSKTIGGGGIGGGRRGWRREEKRKFEHVAVLPEEGPLSVLVAVLVEVALIAWRGRTRRKKRSRRLKCG